MIISNLLGGLGNQLFQFAAGLAAAKRAKTELRLSVDMFRAYRLHQGFELARVFALDGVTASQDEMRDCMGAWRHPWCRKVLGRMVKGVMHEGRMLFQPTVAYWPGVETLGTHVYMQGYWQSERYFASAALELRSALVFREAPSDANAAWLQRIGSTESVGVHVRRGDFVRSAQNRRLYAQCTPAYYAAAMDRMLSHEPEAQFFVFSDEPTWARRLFADRGSRVAVVDHNKGEQSYNDLRLMAHCRHNIIANSSFSWWAAWLGERPGKLVIAPQHWLLPSGWDVDMVPKRWLQLP